MRIIWAVVLAVGAIYGVWVAQVAQRPAPPRPDISTEACKAVAWFGERPGYFAYTTTIRTYRTEVTFVADALRANLAQLGAGTVGIDNPTWQSDLRVTLGAFRRCGNLLRSIRTAPGPVHPLDVTVYHLEGDLAYIEAEVAAGLDGQDAGRIGNAITWLDWLPERLARIDTDAPVSWYGGQIGTDRSISPFRP